MKKSDPNQIEFDGFVMLSRLVHTGGDTYRLVVSREELSRWLWPNQVVAMLAPMSDETLRGLAEEGVFEEGVDWKWLNKAGQGGVRLYNPESVDGFRRFRRDWKRRVAAEKNTAALPLGNGRKAS